MKNFRNSIYQLIVETSTNLPSDVRRVINEAIKKENKNTAGSLALDIIAQNIDMGVRDTGPICQDTGMPTFYIHTPAGTDQLFMKKEILEAVAEATKSGALRPNSVDSLTGRNSGNNLGPGTPVIHFEQWDKEEIEIKLLLKGGGCENKNIQYSLPMELPNLGRADRDLDGIRKCILHAVFQAQGQGCSAGFIGVAVGGDRTSGYEFAKKQLFRSCDDINEDPKLAELEDYILKEANNLNIGTMGFGGLVTLLGCKIGVMNRLPASFFVSVAYNCWAYRRLGVLLDKNSGDILARQYRESDEIKKMAVSEGLQLTGKEISLKIPLSEDTVRKLNVGDIVLLNGEMHFGRDMLHKFLMTNDSPIDLNGGIIYHCGPVALKDNSGKWTMKAAGPTTSIREEPYQADVIKKFGVRGIIGKGGMGQKTLSALKEFGAVYLSAIGGAAQFYIHCIEEVTGVDFLQEFGVPEAMWHIRVHDFPVIVTMDAKGNSLHKDVETESAVLLGKMKEKVF